MPLWEKPEDRERQHKTLVVYNRYKNQLFLETTGKTSAIDGVGIKDEKYVEIQEARGREYRFGFFVSQGGPYINVAKLKTAMAISKLKNLPYVFIMDCIDKMAFIEITGDDYEKWDVKNPNRRKKRGDPYDSQDAYIIPINLFTVIGDSTKVLDSKKYVY